MQEPTILLTSFFKSGEAIKNGYVPYSVAVYQPKGYNYPKLDFFDIRDSGQWTRPRDFLNEQDPVNAYRFALESIYYTREKEIRAWKESLYLSLGAAGIVSAKVALCCWCPFDQAAQRQLSTFGTFVCHTGVIAKMVGQLEPGFMPSIGFDADRSKMVQWKPYSTGDLVRVRMGSNWSG